MHPVFALDPEKRKVGMECAAWRTRDQIHIDDALKAAKPMKRREPQWQNDVLRGSFLPFP